MVTQPFSPKDLKDALVSFERGVNHGVAPELVPRNQLFEAINTSCRGTFVHNRPYFQKRFINFLNPADKAAINAAPIQAACFYKPDAGNESLMLVAGGRLYRFEILGVQAQATDVTGAFPQSAAATQEWVFQAEKWIIWNDAASNPVFWEPVTGSARSNFGSKLPFTTRNSAPFTIPAAGVAVNVTFLNATNIQVGDIVTVGFRGLFVVQDTTASPIISMLNVNATPAGQTIPVFTSDNLSWFHSGTQLPPGRLGTYGLGRVCMSLTDGKQFVIGDSDGGSSGTQAQNYRDAVLQITENLYLAGGGNFAVPGSYGDITAMKFAATLNAALGQGPLQVFTATSVFSCQTPVDRLTWQDVTNPILTETLIAGGGLGQDSTVAANGDTIMRSLEGMRSLILAQREFNTWGNTPISREVDPTFSKDSQDLLPWGSAIVFDNRLLMTTQTVLGPHGPYFRGIVPLNFDPLSSLAGKAPSIYDARLWTGLNIYKLLVGRVQNVDRAFAFTFNVQKDELELYEILPEESTAIADNGITRVDMTLESGTLDFGDSDPRGRYYKRLLNGEIYVDKLEGVVDFMVWWKPDQWPCWVPWLKWSECAKMSSDTSQPQFRPRMGLGEPRADLCDTITNRPLREGYNFRVRIDITGHCEFKGGKFGAVTIPEPQFAPPTCSPICQAT